MNHREIVTTFCLLIIGAAAHAQSGGYTGPENLRLTTVAEALELRDEEDVKLQGFIVRSLGDEEYEFRDDTGAVTVEIDDDAWEGLEVAPDVKVELAGEIEQEREGTELEVESIRLVE
jgi:uncharacterized protein (TIGR00156 family)